MDPVNFDFVREDTGRWYIDLPDWQGEKADLEMVIGADTMLEYVGKGNGKVSLLLSEMPFDSSFELKLMESYSEEAGGGGIYLLENYEGEY